MTKPRGKTIIKYIEEKSRRQVTFSKRRKGLIKIAEKLSTSSDCEVALIIFSDTKKKYEFIKSNRTMEEFLNEYITSSSSNNNASGQLQSVEMNPDYYVVAALRNELTRLRGLYNQLLGKTLEGLNYIELHKLEQQLAEGCDAVRNKKEEEIKRENKALQNEVEELYKQVKSSLGMNRSESVGSTDIQSKEN